MFLEQIPVEFHTFDGRRSLPLAAMTHVDLCELASGRAFAVNAWGTANVVEAAERHHARVICLSTDYVFGGTKEGECVEAPLTGPLNVYVQSKLAAEKHTLRRHQNVVERTSWVFGNGKDFVRTVVAAAEGGRPLQVVANQRGRPTFVGDVVRAVVAGIEWELPGLIHVGGADPRALGRTSRSVPYRSLGCVRR